MARYNVSKREAKKYGIKRVLIDDKDREDKKAKKERKKREKEAKKAREAQEKRLKELSRGASAELLNDPAFQQLTDDQKLVALYQEKIQREDNVQKQAWMEEALNEAIEQSEPYMKNELRIAQDEVKRGFAEAKGDYKTSAEILNRRIDNIEQDLEENKEFLSMEQQAELSRVAQGYEIQRDNLVETHALSGMTFSTKRQLAEKRMTDEEKGIVESTKRQYNKKIADLQKEADRGDLEAQKQLEDLQRQLNEDLTRMGREFEEEYGTENLPPEILGIQNKQASGQPITASEQQLLDNFKRSVDGNIALGGDQAKQFQGIKKTLDKSAIPQSEKTIEKVPDEEIKYEKGKLLGQTKDRTKMRQILDSDRGRQKQPERASEPDFGYKALGDVTGRFEERSVRDVEQRKQALFDEKSRESLNY